MVSPAAGIVTPLDASPLLTVELTEDAARGRSFAEVMGSMLQTLQNRPFCAGGRVCGGGGRGFRPNANANTEGGDFWSGISDGLRGLADGWGKSTARALPPLQA